MVRLTLIVAWNFVRVPVYTVCVLRPCFGHKVESTERMSTQVIGEMQHFLHDRSKIMIDYYDLHFGKKIGEVRRRKLYVVSSIVSLENTHSNTKHRFRGRYKDRDVAIKGLHPKTITVNLLNEFAEEIDLMRKLRHPSVAKILELGCDAPNVVVVLPLYGGGNLKQYLIQNKVHSNSKDVVDLDDDVSSTKLEQKKMRMKRVLCLGTRLSIAIEFCDSVRYIHTLRPPLMHRDCTSSLFSIVRYRHSLTSKNSETREHLNGR